VTGVYLVLEGLLVLLKFIMCLSVLEVKAVSCARPYQQQVPDYEEKTRFFRQQKEGRKMLRTNPARGVFRPVFAMQTDELSKACNR
jgi:hypothetical protein